MKRLAAIAVLLLASQSAGAQQAITLAVHESRTIQVLGATAAWAIDASVVDAAVQNGQVLLFGRSAGTTAVMVVSVTGQNALDVTVAGPKAARAQAPTSRADRGTAEARYSSSTKEIQNNISITREDKTRRTEIELRTSHHATEPAGDRAKTSITSASIRFFKGSRELTLLDGEVDHSPLTLSNTPLRGIHYVDEHLRLHAGYTTYTSYRSLFIPLERELVAGAGWAFRPSRRSTVTPAIFAYRGRGSVLSMLYDFDDASGTALQTELAYSNGGFGGSANFSRRNERDLVRANLRYRPRSFAAASGGMPPGLIGDAIWNRNYASSTLSATASVSEVAGIRAIAGSADVDHRLSDLVSLTGGASWGSFGEIESVVVPAGVRLDLGRAGIAAVYRHARSSTNSGGHGGRVSAHASLGHFHASAYADRQQNAPTLDLILRDAPELAVALDELGITATSPSDIARALREHAALAELGFIEGVTIDLAPVRTQYGFDLAWMGGAASRQQLRFRYVQNTIESVASETETTIATLTYGRRLSSSSDLYASYSYWRTRRAGEPAHVQPYFELGVRQQFDSLPSLGGGTISGAVFADDDLDGRSDGSPLHAEIELDGSRIEQTRADGSFAFENVTRGSHQVVARVVDRPEAYFTTPSRVEAEPGDRVVFGVASTPARLIGRVTSDAGEGIAGVRMLLVRGTNQINATTDTSGNFTLVAAPGEWQLSIATDSVAAGYSLAGTEPRAVVLDRVNPLHVVQELRANRSIAGSGALPNSAIEVPALGRTVRSDAEGRFALRNLPPGKIALVAGGITREVVVPRGPARLPVDFTTAKPAPDEIRVIATGERRDTMRWAVQLGAFRIRSNAVDAVARAKRQGVAASIGTSGALAIVRTSPYDTRDAAESAAMLLDRAGLETIVVSTN